MQEDAPQQHNKRGWLYIAVPLLLIGVACARLYPAYTTFTGTIDEPSHIACGLQWLDKDAYTYDRQHPPLARIAIALGPYLNGITSGIPKADRTYPTDIFFSQESYFRNLTLARIGNLPFFVLICIVVYMWASQWFDRATALWALLLFTCLPPILGHSAVATLDIACAATVAAALYQFVRWLERPQILRALILALAISLAVLSKFSSLGFLPACFGLAGVYLWIVKRDLLVGGGMLSTRFKQVAIVCVVTFFVVWANYKFSLNAIAPTNGRHLTVDARIGNPILRHAAYALLELPLPLMEIKDGIEILSEHNETGHPSFLLGEFRATGWWYFFPVVVAVKTPLAFLALAAVGTLVLWRRRGDIPWQQVLTLIFPIAILLVCLTSRIDLGVRHILSIYPMLSVLGGLGMARLTDNLHSRHWRVAGYLLMGWLVVESIVVHPDYLAYFNELAGRHPEAILCESDLDWGQDLHRLSARLQALGVKEVAIRYFGTFPLEQANLPPHRDVPPHTPISGYVAISIHDLMLENARDGSFSWLKKLEPVEKIGKSIYLFDVKF